MAELIYLLCLLTSASCAFLLVRSYLQNRSRILLWSTVCFVGLSVNNALLFIDLAILPESIDLAPLRASIALASTLVLVVGLIWDAC